MEKKRIELFLFVDALGWDIVGNSGYLIDTFPHRHELEMQFGYSCTAIPTILSGTRPAEHGHLGLFRYAPNASPFRGVSRFMRILWPRSFWNRGRVRNWMSRFVKRHLGYTGYFQLYNVDAKKLASVDYCEKYNLFLPGGMGKIKNLADVLQASGISHHISDWHKSDDENFQAGIEEIKKGTDFIFIYTSSLDALRHDYLDDVEDKLEWLRRRIYGLITELKHTGRDYHFTIFSDHGMTPLKRVINVRTAIERTGLIYGIDYGACYDSTLFRVHYLTPRAKVEIEKAMEKFADAGHWLDEQEERHYGIWRKERDFGDALFLVNPGVQIAPSDMGIIPLNAMHGYDPADAHSLAMAMSNKPLPDYLHGVWDIFKMMKEAIDGSKG